MICLKWYDTTCLFKNCLVVVVWLEVVFFRWKMEQKYCSLSLLMSWVTHTRHQSWWCDMCEESNVCDMKMWWWMDIIFLAKPVGRWLSKHMKNGGFKNGSIILFFVFFHFFWTDFVSKGSHNKLFVCFRRKKYLHVENSFPGSKQEISVLM